MTNLINSIRRKLMLNSLVVYVLALVTVLSLYFNYKTSSSALKESREFLYAYNTEGDIIPMKWVNRRENIEIEIKNHITHFVKCFYDLNLQKWESNINKALYVGDFEKIHTDRMNKGYYNKFIQFNVVQSAELYPENIEIDMTSKTYNFRILIVIAEAYQGEKPKVFNIFAKGEIQLTDRNFPWNPHGMLINNYVEEEITKIEK